MMRPWRTRLAVAAIVLITASPVFAEAAQDAAWAPGILVKRDVAYGPDPLQRLDVYLPAHAENAPVLFMVHGGGWRRGDKAAAGVVRNKAKYWLAKGYVFISTNYRLVPQVDPLTEADDVARAMAFAQGKAESWGGDPSRFVLMGHSAGAHLVSLVTAAPDIAKKQGVRPWLGTASLDSAAYNVVKVMTSRHFQLYDIAFGNNRKLWREASPILRLEKAPVPMLLVCSKRRKLARVQVDAFAAKISALGGRVTVLPVDLDHGEINKELGVPGEYTRQVELFMQSLGLK